MKVFLIIVAVLAVIIIAVLSLSATLTVVYDKGWHTKVCILFIERDIVLSKILSFILFPEQRAKEASEKSNEKKKKNDKNKKSKDNKENTKSQKDSPLTVENKTDEKLETDSALKDTAAALNQVDEEVHEKPKDYKSDKKDKKEEKALQDSPESAPKKSNPIKNLWDKEGIVGILSFVSNLLQTANSAVTTLIKGLHIYSLYVMILVGGGDADMIARSYGTLCKYYYPLKGMILSSMKVDNYDDYIQPDFIADRTEVEFQLIVSINVALLLKVGLKAVAVFLKNLIANNKASKAQKG